MIPEPHVTWQGAVTWRNQCHDRATLQGVIIPSTILKIVYRHILFFFVFNGVWALTSGGFRIVSDTLVHGCHTDLSQHAETSGTRQTARISWTPQRLTQFLRVHRLLLHSSFRYFCSTKAELRDRCCLSVCLSVTP